jgi:hypothetical protein
MGATCPFGALVVPELYWISPGSPGVIAAARAVTAPSWAAPPASSSLQLGAPTAALQRRNGIVSSPTSAAMSSARVASSRRVWVRTPLTAERVSRSRSSAGAENVDSGTATPPASATPKIAATISGRLPITIATRVEWPTPRAIRPAATARASRQPASA